MVGHDLGRSHGSPEVLGENLSEEWDARSGLVVPARIWSALNLCGS